MQCMFHIIYFRFNIMRTLFVIAALLCAAAMAEKWAMVMGTADGWSNYSITSDPCRAYDLLAASGIAPEHIIFMSYTSNYESKSNPFPGKIFTDPSDGEGKDYAPGCRSHIDYTADSIDKEVVKAIFLGDKATVTELTGIENPKVFETTEEDTIFIYFIDHGNEGLVCIGNSYMRETEFIDTFKKMYEKKMYKEFVFYMEACHSGSMFRKIDENWNIYALTSSDPYHNAWMSNCPPDDVVNGKELDTCLAGLYDNAWMDIVEQSQGGNVTLAEIFKHVDSVVKAEGSDQAVSQYGPVEKFSQYPINRFIGDKPIPKAKFSVSKSGKVVRYQDVPRHVATWKAIRADKAHLEASLEDLKKIVVEEAMNEVKLMRLARAVSGDDVKAEMLRTSVSNGYSEECAQEIAINLMEKCGFTMPFSESALNTIHNICSKNVNYNIDYSDVCF